MPYRESLVTLTAGLSLVLLAANVGCTQSEEAPEPPEKLAVTWLANEGVLLEAGERRVLIDAFVPEPYSMYTFLPDQVAADMLVGKAPFSGIDLALVSHVHRDHFQADFANAFLAAHEQTPLLSSRQVLELVTREDNVETHYPQPGQSSRWSTDGIDVEFLNLSHGSGRFAGIQNLGHIVTIDGFKVLHIGDAAMQARNFAPYGLAERGLDVALVPYWYFSSDAGRAIVDEHLVADLTIAVHLPRAGADTENLDAARQNERVQVPAQPMQRWEIARPAPE